MSDPLLRYYEQELALVKRSLGQFGQNYPGHAQGLEIHQGQIEDPSLARLLDGTAMLNANIVKRLSEQLPEVVEGLLDVLYPSYMQTVPSVAYLKLDSEADTSEATTVPKGTQFTGVSQGTECIFSTVDELKITPYVIQDISALSAPFNFNRPTIAENTSAAIQITLTTGDDAIHFSHLELEDLDFFVQGFENNADSLVELLLTNVVGISVSDSDCVEHSTTKRNQLKSRISDLNFKFLSEHGNQFSGYQLINEFFFFKEKKQFFRLKEFGKLSKSFNTSTIKLNLFMSHIPSEFMRLFDLGVFKLNVVPAINQFSQTGEPVTYDHRKLSVPINADAHSDNIIEILSIDKVYEITPEGEKTLTPLSRGKYRPNAQASWQSKRDGSGDHQLMVTLNQNGSKGGQEYNKLFGTQLTCTNGKAACGVSGNLECIDSIDLPGDFTPLFPPSAPIERELDQNIHWQFILLLNSNLASLLHAEDKPEALKQLLQLCSREQVSNEEVTMIRDVEYRSQVSAIRISGKNVFAPGTEIILTLDTNSPYLAFCDVLNRFFQQFCSFDRYIQLKIRHYGRDNIVRKYPKIHGSQLCT